MFRLTRNLILVSLLLATGFGVAETTRCTAITELPFVIDRQGAYCLVRNLAYSGDESYAVWIKSDNVSIDLNGFSLLGVGPDVAADVRAFLGTDRKNVTIRNGTIRGFNRAVYLRDDSDSISASQNHLVEHIRAVKCSRSGIDVSGSSVTIRHNQVLDTGGAPFQTNGIDVRGRGARVSHNTITRTLSVAGGYQPSALVLDKAPGAVVQDNLIDIVTSELATTYGVRILKSKNVMASGNRISRVENGIFYSGSTGKYMDNLTSKVDVPYTGGTAAGVNH